MVSPFLSGQATRGRARPTNKVPLASAEGEGTIRYADGTVWDPDGLGAGYFYFSGTDWIRMSKGATATEWLDIDFPIVARTAVANNPTPTTLKGNLTAPTWAVNDWSMCEGQELIHGWKEGSTAYWHCHILTAAQDATNRYLKFEIEYVWAKFNTALQSVSTVTQSGEILIPANTPAYTHIIASIAPMTLTTAEIGTQVFARLKRIAAAGTAPSANPFITMLQMHIEVNSLGSRLISDK